MPKGHWHKEFQITLVEQFVSSLRIFLLWLRKVSAKSFYFSWVIPDDLDLTSSSLTWLPPQLVTWKVRRAFNKQFFDFVFWLKVLQCGPGWPGIPYVVHTGLKNTILLFQSYDSRHWTTSSLNRTLIKLWGNLRIVMVSRQVIYKNAIL